MGSLYIRLLSKKKLVHSENVQVKSIVSTHSYGPISIKMILFVFQVKSTSIYERVKKCLSKLSAYLYFFYWPEIHTDR